jgi:BirA family transcriptional regulator, biotin operon repressor / biotin---[acetyl-CoA-carboxylase] ligase
MKLGTHAIDAGHRLISYDSIDSTNAEALRLAPSQDTQTPLWIVAGRQTAGRGRQGRVWSSPPGNFYGSLLLTNPCELRHAAKLGFVAGVALVEALAKIAPALKGVSLKWPNDALLNGAKIAGIALEASNLPAEHNKFVVVIGVGINLAFHPDDTPYPASNLAAHGAPISAQDCLIALSNSFVQKLNVFDQGRNFDTIRKEWLKQAHGLGELIKVRTQAGQTTGQIEGQFGGIDETGSLILNQNGKAQLISVGDVYFAG